MALPLHIDPPAGNNSRATAPYNFIPLPERVLTAEQIFDGVETDARPWVNHHRILDGHHSGHIDLEIKTLTPTYTRGACLFENGDWDERQARQRPEPMTSDDGKGVPVLPGSSIRGAVRSIFEILTFSKLQPITDKSSFYRTLPPARVGRFYHQQVVAGEEKPRGGHLIHDGDTWFIQPAEVLQVRHHELEEADLPKPFKYQQRPDYWPDERLHKQLVSFDRNDGGKATNVSQDLDSGAEVGRLVLTGAAPKKKHEFIFVQDPQAEPVKIPAEVWENFNSDRQISQWQERRWRHDRNGGRPIDGAAANDDPVFYLTTPDGNVQFFGRARMFRLPYDQSPSDLLSDEHSAEAPLDMTEALFGTVAGDRILKGRLSFSSAAATGSPPEGEWCERTMVPRMLSAPKPTSYPHYLVQDGNVGPDQHTTYLKQDRTTIRGHKLYWHRRPTGDHIRFASEDDEQRLIKEIEGGRDGGRMHTIIKPVKRGVVFKGQVRFTNLTTVELGALLTALDLPPDCAHRIGMAKSLGLGSVRITSRLSLRSPAQRYRRPSESAEKSDVEQTSASAKAAFVQLVNSHAEVTGEVLTDGDGLRRFRRLDALFLMLDYKNAPDVETTGHLELPEFRSRRVLPSPHGVRGLDLGITPSNRRPVAAESEYRPQRPGGGRGRGAHRRFDQSRGGRQGGRPQKKTLPAGPVTMVVSERTTRKGAPILEYQSESYVFAPNAAPTDTPSPGDQLQVRIKVKASGPNTGQVEYQSEDDGDQ